MFPAARPRPAPLATSPPPTAVTWAAAAPQARELAASLIIAQTAGSTAPDLSRSASLLRARARAASSPRPAPLAHLPQPVVHGAPPSRKVLRHGHAQAFIAVSLPRSLQGSCRIEDRDEYQGDSSEGKTRL